MVHDKYGRQIEVGDEVIVRCRVRSIDETLLHLRPVFGTPQEFGLQSYRVEKVASDPGPFLTNDMPVKGDKCAG